ncbi:undecaprenyl diphosphate synthase family protein [Streptomyces sp. Go-475]|uniref:undecaprenyl diphosphate synthase family protein n=1 Tax=Streptomyces sp. Go-475 TaxID=2072505 RepID=UPI000DF0C211|nr:undecaprenyl diphosphate synthase family protein [Streptomyces sp. Go-475]AXE89526.1 Decaprenyl diphosphate synthase [Streptomyces sp. Go-475]
MEIGLEHLTLYTFSTENWKRPADELQTLMYEIRQVVHRPVTERVDVCWCAPAAASGPPTSFPAGPYPAPLFLDTPWPAVDRRTLRDAMERYARRTRRYGSVARVPAQAASLSGRGAPRT